MTQDSHDPDEITEIKITRDMIDAGLSALTQFNWEQDYSVVIISSVYEAMRLVELGTSTHKAE